MKFLLLNLLFLLGLLVQIVFSPAAHASPPGLPIPINLLCEQDPETNPEANLESPFGYLVDSPTECKVNGCPGNSEINSDDKCPVLPLLVSVKTRACVEPPDLARVLRALPNQISLPLLFESYREDIDYKVEKLADYVGPKRFIPRIGAAHLRHCHWKCTLYYTEVNVSYFLFPFKCQRKRTAVVYFHTDHLHLVAEEERNSEAQIEIPPELKKLITCGPQNKSNASPRQLDGNPEPPFEYVGIDNLESWLLERTNSDQMEIHRNRSNFKRIHQLREQERVYPESTIFRKESRTQSEPFFSEAVPLPSDQYLEYSPQHNPPSPSYPVQKETAEPENATKKSAIPMGNPAKSSNHSFSLLELGKDLCKNLGVTPPKVELEIQWSNVEVPTGGNDPTANQNDAAGSRRMYLIGQRCLKDGDIKTAIACFTEAQLRCPICPHGKKASQRLAEIEMQKSESEEAEPRKGQEILGPSSSQICPRLRNRKPTRQEFRLRRLGRAQKMFHQGQKCLAKRDYDQALVYFQKTRRLCPRSDYAVRAAWHLRNLKLHKVLQQILGEAANHSGGGFWSVNREYWSTSETKEHYQELFESLFWPIFQPLDSEVSQAVKKNLDNWEESEALPTEQIFEFEMWSQEFLDLLRSISAMDIEVDSGRANQDFRFHGYVNFGMSFQFQFESPSTRPSEAIFSFHRSPWR